MNARQYVHFLAALETGSLQKAAQRLNLSQPAVSKSIGKLEDEYGMTLFERTPRGLRPTAFARELERHARRVTADIARSHAAAEKMRMGRMGTLSVGAGPVFVNVVNDIISEMIADGYDGEFSILQDYNDNLRRRLQSNEIDLFIAMITGREDPREFNVELLLTDRIVCACRATHPILTGEITDERLLSYRWIAHEDGEIGRRMLEGHFHRQQLATPQFQVITNTEKTLQRFLHASDTISVVPEVALDQPGFEGIVAIAAADLTFVRKVGLVTRVGPAFATLVDVFLERLRKQFRERICSQSGQDVTRRRQQFEPAGARLRQPAIVERSLSPDQDP